MAEPKTKYKYSLNDVRNMCPHVQVDVVGAVKTERLVGKYKDTVIIQSKPGGITNARVTEFVENYNKAVEAGIVKIPRGLSEIDEEAEHIPALCAACSMNPCVCMLTD